MLLIGVFPRGDRCQNESDNGRKSWKALLVLSPFSCTPSTESILQWYLSEFCSALNNTTSFSIPTRVLFDSQINGSGFCWIFGSGPLCGREPPLAPSQSLKPEQVQLRAGLIKKDINKWALGFDIVAGRPGSDVSRQTRRRHCRECEFALWMASEGTRWALLERWQEPFLSPPNSTPSFVYA